MIELKVLMMAKGWARPATRAGRADPDAARSGRRRAVCALFVLLMPLWLPGCAGPAYNAFSDFDDSYDFGSVRSIAILPIDRTTAAENLISDVQATRINTALKAELEKLGYTVVDDRVDADAYLGWHLVTRERTDIRSYNAASAYSCWRCGPPVADVSVRHYMEGTLIVDLIDPLRNRSVWRSTVQSELRAQPDPDEAAVKREAAIRAALEPFPPAES
jgi:hypothetical protein